MAELLFPDRKMCKSCGKLLVPGSVLKRLFCSYKCAGVRKPSDGLEAASRACKKPSKDGKGWEWKKPYDYAGKVHPKLQADPTVNIYECERCLMFHIGHNKVDNVPGVAGVNFKRAVPDLQTLGSVIERRRLQYNLDKKILAKKMKVPAIRITEIEAGNPNMNMDVLFRLLFELRLTFELSGR
jgi:hypothetical protein